MTNIPTYKVPKSLHQRHLWYDKLWWLTEVGIKNPEWRELLIDDGVNTLSIEGEFNSKWDLHAILDNPNYPWEWVKKVMNFFDAATIAYNYAKIEHSEWQNLKLPISLLHTVHSRLFHSVPRQFSQNPGEFAKGQRELPNSTIEPVPPILIEGKIKSLMEILSMKKVSLLEKITFFHAAFEYIHPYPDGNGRVWRVAMNTLLIMAWFPNIAIKGIKKSDRENYYAALRACDPEIAQWLKWKSLLEIDFSVTKKFQKIIIDWLKQSLDIVICVRFEEKNWPLIPARQVAVMLGKNPSTFAVQCANKDVINVVRWHKAYTHPDLCK